LQENRHSSFGRDGLEKIRNLTAKTPRKSGFYLRKSALSMAENLSRRDTDSQIFPLPKPVIPRFSTQFTHRFSPIAVAFHARRNANIADCCRQ
jgi:hypothetical protein